MPRLPRGATARSGPLAGRKYPKPYARQTAVVPMQGVSGTTAQAMRTGGWANPTRGGELKFVDTNPTTTPAIGVVTWTAGTLLNGLANGSDASTRVGRKITMKSLLMKYFWKCDPASTGGSPLRILIVYDKQANAAAPAITDILLLDNFNSPNNLSNRDRFVTLVDHYTEPIGIAGNFGVGGSVYKKLNMETMFNAGSAGTIGDITSGSVYLFVAQNGGILTVAGDFDSRVRIRYTDV